MRRSTTKVRSSKQRLPKLRFLPKLGYQKSCWNQARLFILVNKQVVLEAAWQSQSHFNPKFKGYRRSIPAPEAISVLQDQSDEARSQKDLKKQNKYCSRSQNAANGPKGGFRNKDVAAESNMWLQAGAKKQLQEPIWLQKPIYDYRSQDVTAGAMMWLQEQRFGYRS